MNAVTDRQFCTLELGGLLLGVPVDEVQEVLVSQDMTRVPLAPPAVQGLINLRGQIVAVVDLRQVLGLDPRKGGELGLNVVLRYEGGSASLLVDEIGDVVEVHPDAFEPPPETLEGVLRELVTCVYKLEHGLLIVIDAAKAVDLGMAT